MKTKTLSLAIFPSLSRSSFRSSFRSLLLSLRLHLFYFHSLASVLLTLSQTSLPLLQDKVDRELKSMDKIRRDEAESKATAEAEIEARKKKVFSEWVEKKDDAGKTFFFNQR